MKTESRIQVAANTVKEKYKSPACVMSPGSWLLNSKPQPQSGSRQSEDIFILFKKMGTENSDSFTIRSESHSGMSDSLWPRGLYSPWNSPGHNTGVDSPSLLQGSFPTQESNCIASRFFTNWSPSPLPLPKFMPPSFHIWIIAIVSLLVHVLLFLPLSNTFLLRYKSDHVMLHLKSLNALSVDLQQKEYLLIIYKTRTAWLMAPSPSHYRHHDLLTVPSIYPILSYSRTTVFAVIFSLNT